MADSDEEPADEVAAPEGKPKATKRKKMMIAGAGALLLIGGGGGAYAYLSGGDKADAAGEQAEAETDGEAPVFVDVPPMVVNLRSADGVARFIKLHFMLVPGKGVDATALEKRLPLLLDAYQPFLRELRPEDLAGAAAVFRIKEEMLIRATDVLGRGQVKDVLIQDLIQQ